MPDTPREPGYYWLTDKISGAHFVARFEGEWEFIGSLWSMAENERDDRGDLFSEKYTVGARIPEPSNA